MKYFKFLIAGVFAVFFSGQVLAEKIVIGQTADFSKAAAPILKEFAIGANAYFAKVNSEGGVSGSQVELISMDDGFDPARTVANAKVLIENPSVVALFGPRGTPNLNALLPLAQESKIAVVAPLIGASVVRDEKYTVSFPMRATYKQEADEGLKAASWSGQKISIIYPDDAYGKEMSTHVMAKLKESYPKLSLVSTIQFDRMAKEFTPQVKELASKVPDSVMLFCSANACASFLKEWDIVRKKQQLPMVRFVTNSIVDLQAQRDVIGVASDFVVATQILPSPTKFGKIQEGYAKALKGKEPSYPSYEGWLSAHVLVEALKKAKKPVTRASLLVALDSLRVEMDYGFVVDFTTRFKQTTRFVDVITVDSNKHVVR